MRKNKTEKLEERLEELTRRIDTLATELHTSDSKYGLHQLPELRERLDNLASRLALDENEFRIFREIVSTLQRDSYRQKN